MDFIALLVFIVVQILFISLAIFHPLMTDTFPRAP